MILSGSSPLSRQYYAKTAIKDRYIEIIKKLDEIYNRKNKGLDIFFEGTSANYVYISNVINTYFPDRDIVCKTKVTKIAVVGKKGSGKTTLIEGIAREKGYNFEIIKKGRYVSYTDRRNNISWIELKGIDHGENEISKAFSTIRDLAEEDLDVVVYCISGDSGRIESTEKNFIENIDVAFSAITVLAALTKCYKEDVQKIIDEIKRMTNHMEVFPTLAKEYKVSEKMRGMIAPYVVAPFGINELCTYVFEGKKLSRQFQDILKTATSYSNQELDAFGRRIEVQNAITPITIDNKKIDLSKNKQSKENETVKNEVLKENRESDSYIKRDDYKIEEVKETKKADTAKKKATFEKIAVIGKKAVGKTSLIEGIEAYIGQTFNQENCKNYNIYEDRKSNIQWYEVKEIDLGKNKIEETYAIVKELIAEGLKVIFYCISGVAGKIEDSELSLIRRMAAEYPKVSVVVLLTMCYKEDIEDTIDEIQKVVGKIKIIPTLARDYKTKIKIPKTGENLVISPFGLDAVYQYANGVR